jgi:hypothetical protein
VIIYQNGVEGKKHIKVETDPNSGEILEELESLIAKAVKDIF